MTANPRLSYMLRKLYALVSGSCTVDNPDSPQHQEVLLPGYLYGMIIKERLEEALNQVRNQIATDVRRAEPPPDFLDSELLFHISSSRNSWRVQSGTLRKLFKRSIGTLVPRCPISLRLEI